MLSLIDGMRRRWSTVAIVTLLGAVLAGVITLLQPPVFKGEALLLIEEPNTPSGLASSLAKVPSSLSSLVGVTTPTITEMEILQSRPVLAAVLRSRGETAIDPDLGLGLLTEVDDLDRIPLWKSYLRRLRGRPEPAGSLQAAVVGWDYPDSFQDPLRVHFLGEGQVEVSFERLFGGDPQTLSYQPGTPFDYQGASLVLRPQGELAGRTFRITHVPFLKAVKNLRENLGIREATRGSNIVEITYHANDAERAAQVVNELVRSYSVHNRERQLLRAQRSVGFLEAELERVRRELAQAEEELEAFSTQVGPLAIPETAETLVEQLVAVDLERAKYDLSARSLEDLLERIRAGKVSDGELAGYELATGLPGDQVVPLAALLARRSALETQYQEDWPQLRATNAEIEQRLAGITNVLEGRIWQDGQLAKDLGAIQATYEEKMQELPEAAIQVLRYKRRVEAYSQISLFLLGQLQEAKVSIASAETSSELVEEAAAPRLRDRPRLSLNLAVGLLVGLVAGCWMALLLELKRPLGSVAQLAQATGAPDLNAIPWEKGLRGNVAATGSSPSAGAEAFRLLQSSLQAVCRDGGRALAVIGTSPGDGVSLVTAHLGRALARAGQRVLLVDTNAAHPDLHRLFGLEFGSGWSEALGGEVPWREAKRETGVDGLELLSLGRSGAGGEDRLASSAAGELLAEMAKEFDFVLCDTAAMGTSSDPALLAGHLGSYLLVARADKTLEAEAVAVTERLVRAGARACGVVLNGVRRA